MLTRTEENNEGMWNCRKHQNKVVQTGQRKVRYKKLSQK